MVRKPRNKSLKKQHKSDKTKKSKIKEQVEVVYPASGIVNTQKEVAYFFAVSWRTVANWAQKGMPIREDGKYDIKEIQEWKFLRNPRSKSRKAAEQESQNWEIKYREYKAKLAEIDLKKAKGELIPLSSAEEILRSLIREFKKNFLGIPRQLAPQLEGLTSAEIQHAMEIRIKTIISEFAKGKF